MRSVTCSLMNWTGENLSFTSQNEALASGVYAAGKAPPVACGDITVWVAESNSGGVTGTAAFQGASGGVTVTWDVPVDGANSYTGTPSGSYVMTRVDGEKVGANPGVVYRIDLAKVVSPPTSPPPPPVPDPADADSETHSDNAHVPIHTVGKPVVISPKRWLVDIAWQGVNHVEWDDLILEMTENRHGVLSSKLGDDGRPEAAAKCPVNLPDFAKYGIKKSGTCDKAHNFFYSWCGDYVSWVYWKAFVLKTDEGAAMKVDKATLGSFLNREALNGSWTEGMNLNMVEAYARGVTVEALKKSQYTPATPPDPNRLLVWHNPKDGFLPQKGDIYLLARDGGGHIGIIYSFDQTPRGKGKVPYYEYVSLDGKSFDKQDLAHDDPGWAKANEKAELAHEPHDLKAMEAHQQGVVQNFRRTDTGESVRGYIDASKLRDALGYR